MKLLSLLITVVIVSIVSFMLDGAWHMGIMKATYDQTDVLLAPVSVPTTGIPWQYLVIALLTNYIFLRLAMNASDKGLSKATSVETFTLGFLAITIFYNVSSMYKFADWPVSVSIIDMIWHTVNGAITGFTAALVVKMFNKS